MNKGEVSKLLELYEQAVDQLHLLYAIGSPAEPTIVAESKVQQMKEVLTIFNIDFKE